MPGRRWRTIATAQRIPKSVFSGTTTAAISSVNFSACTAFGFEIASQNGWSPGSNARQKTRATGAMRSAPRYARGPNVALLECGLAAHGPDAPHQGEADHERAHGA